MKTITKWVARLAMSQPITSWQLQNVASIARSETGGLKFTDRQWSCGEYSQDYCEVEVGPEADHLFESPEFREIEFREGGGLYAANHWIATHPIYAGYARQDVAEVIAATVLRDMLPPSLEELLRDTPVFYRHNINPLPRAREILRPLTKGVTVSYYKETGGNPIRPRNEGDWTLRLTRKGAVITRRFCVGGCGRQAVIISANVGEMYPNMSPEWWDYIQYGWSQRHLENGCVREQVLPLDANWTDVCRQAAKEAADYWRK